MLLFIGPFFVDIPLIFGQRSTGQLFTCFPGLGFFFFF